MTRLNVICKSNSVSFPVKLKLFKSLVVPILLYGRESKIPTVDLERRIQAFEHKCYRRLLRISYTQHRTNEFVRHVTNYARRQEPLLATETGLVVTYPLQDSLVKIILQGTVESKQRRGKTMKSYLMVGQYYRLDETADCPVAAHGGRPTALARHGFAKASTVSLQ